MTRASDQDLADFLREYEGEPIKLWTWEATPFKFGASRWPIATMAKPTHEFVVKGFKCYVVPNSTKELTHIVDAVSGGIVGTSTPASLAIAVVIQDIATSDLEVMRRQVEHAKGARDAATMLEESEFFRRFKA